LDTVKHLTRNLSGRDIVVGDIHGCFSTLDEKLRQIRFDPARDRLFSVGDLVDRGQDSPRALEYLAEKWFHAVRGNHEQMALDFAAGSLDFASYEANGGDWFIALPPQDRAPYLQAFGELPIAMEIETIHGLIGIVHAECPVSRWGELPAALDSDPRLATACLWSRGRIQYGRDDDVHGVEAVIVGHTPVRQVTSLGNVVFIDTGLVFGGELTILELTAMVPGP
jgi:serine/threonine protein phosphatase 1